MNPLFRRVAKAEAHYRIMIAFGCAALAFATSFPWRSLPVAVIVAWNAFALVSLTLVWMGMLFSDAKSCVREAVLQDSSRAVICFCVIFAAVASLFAVGALLVSTEGMERTEAGRHVVLAALTVISSWLLVHSIMAVHYAHIFYRLSARTEAHTHGVGLDFPEEKHPDFLDFAYFSFVIGMTCQTSDVQITSRRIRRTALLHGVLTFAFNTVILALSINIASGLFAK